MYPLKVGLCAEAAVSWSQRPEMSTTVWLASDQMQDQLLRKVSGMAELWLQKAAPCFQKDFALHSNDAFVCPEQVQHWLQDMCTCRDEPALANLPGRFEPMTRGWKIRPRFFRLYILVDSST